MKYYKKLDRLWEKGRVFLNCDYPIIGGAMTWVSEANLVAAISNAGGFGVIASGAMPAEALEAEINKTLSLTDSAFGVNLITMHPEIEALIQVCIKKKVKYVILAGGLPQKKQIETLKQHAIKVICFAPTLALAKRLVRQGIDALIVEGMEAGGHIGPVATSVLAQEILPHIHEVPVFIAGGIGDGVAIASYLMMGAAGVQCGTRFVCATEAKVHDNFKQAFIRANARDAVTSAQLDGRFPVIPVRALKNKATESFLEKQKDVIKRYESEIISLQEAQLEIEHFWAGRLRAGAMDGDIENGSLMAGQSVGFVKKVQPVSEIISELCEGAEKRLI